MFETLNRHQTRSTKWDMALEACSTKDVLAFSVADSDYETAPCVKAALRARVEQGAFGYTYLDETYRKAVLDWFLNRYQLSVNAECLLTTSKVLTSLALIIECLTDKNDVVIIQTPVYHVFYPLIKQHKRRVLENPLKVKNGYYTMDFDHLITCFEAGAKMIVICSPHNPVGRVWRKAELERLIALCKQYDVWLVSDEIHADLIMPNHPFYSAGAFQDATAKIIVVNAPSKTFNLAGLQTANMIVYDRVARVKLSNLLKRFYLEGSNLFGIEAVIAAYSEGATWVDAQNQHIFSNFNRLKQFLQTHYPQLELTPLEGTYLAWINVSSIDPTGQQLYQACCQVGLVLSPGEPFSKNSAPYLRMNLACSTAQLEAGLKRLHQGIKMISTP